MRGLAPLKTGGAYHNFKNMTLWTPTTLWMLCFRSVASDITTAGVRKFKFVAATAQMPCSVHNCAKGRCCTKKYACFITHLKFRNGGALENLQNSGPIQGNQNLASLSRGQKKYQNCAFRVSPLEKRVVWPACHQHFKTPGPNIRKFT